VRTTACTECHKAIVELGRYLRGAALDKTYKAERRVWPRTIARVPLSLAVPDEYRTDYDEACAVLEVSAKASAALSRRALQHLLRHKLGITKPTLSAELDELLARKDLPEDIAEDVDAIRHLGNFAAHPERVVATGEIVDVEPHEAEWSLTLLEDLFEHYFVRPEQRLKRRADLEAKLVSAGKKPAIKKPPTP
jgi:Domain of unknown function (DUF4145)